MTPKQKAEELVNKYDETLTYLESKEKAKQCALIAVDLAIEAAILYVSQEIAFEKSKEYWQQVKDEILNL